MMQRCGVLAGILLVAACAVGAEPLFDGKTLQNWKYVGLPGKAGFTVENGVLKTEHGGKGLIWYTPKKLGNGTLRVVYSMDAENGNSGVFIRIPIEPQSNADAINKGIEVQIDNKDNEYHCTGVLYSMTKAMARPYKPAGEWNTMEITMRGARTIVKVNGVLVTDYDGVAAVPDKKESYEPDRGPRPDVGYIALQNHDGNAIVSFREVVWEPAGAK